MQVKDFLKLVRPTKTTYHNIESDSIDYFKNQYLYLKRHKDKNLKSLYINYIKNLSKSIRHDYSDKLEIMTVIQQAIIF